MKTIQILGAPVAAGTKTQVLQQCISLIQNCEAPLLLACLNPHSCALATKDSDFAGALIDAALLVPDGIGIVLASLLTNQGVIDRVTGSDVFEGLCRYINEQGGTMYLIGTTPPVLERLESMIKGRFVNVRIVGSFCPPFTSNLDDLVPDQIISDLWAKNPDVVWVGLGAPKQELWVSRMRSKLPPAVYGAVGAVFDFYSGEKARAPSWIQVIGLEWLHRLFTEPVRMWKRTFVSVPIFAWSLLLRKKILVKATTCS